MKSKVTIKWSKRENDWIGHYPDRNGKRLTHALFDMISKWEEFMSVDWRGHKTDFEGFRTYLENAGYDSDTFTISVKMKKSK